MNLRALALLLLFLLTQAGSVVAGACEKAAPAQQCPHECCVSVASAEPSLQTTGCACLQSSQESQPPAQAPVVPASSSRDLASQQSVWLYMALADLWLSQSPREFHPVEAGRMEVVKPLYAVPVQVLHCAFLI
ncbi:hypothetical protein [Verrucomicrobium sp. BvORR034]|uniref:hypothetical protein n=1 Tax=Verrucomicrobium sp. BvORR034 TaxID=1396418 RepID=UPI000679E16A|nr:hypothetical protein [Verrucomicrobium sp. BvORR034]